MSVINTICIPLSPEGNGGLSGGQGAQGQASQIQEGFAARSYGIPVIKTTTGITADFTVQLAKDNLGTVPADISDSDTVNLVCRYSSGILFNKTCTVGQTGFVSFTIAALDVNGHPGIHYAEFQVRRDDTLIKVFRCCVEVMKGLTGCLLSSNTPLTILEVRMLAYDTSALRNLLLGDLLFSDVQIVYAIQKAIDDWNLMPPALANTYTVETFPFRSNLCTGAVGHLLQMAAYRYARNQMRHSNAGLSLDDNDKYQVYSAQSQAALAKWTMFIEAKKSLINQLECMGTVSDAYFLNYHGWMW